MQNKPLVSILLLSMNHEKYIQQCIESIINQSYQNIEIIYLDNASHDNSFLLGKELLGANHIPHKVFSNQFSIGISENLNFLIKHSAGQFLVPLSTDDWWDINNIDVKINFFQKNRQYGMLYSDGYIYYPNATTCLFSEKDHFYSGHILEKLLNYNFVKAPSVMLKREVLNDIGLYDEGLLIEDWDLWIRTAERYPIGYINLPLVYYRYSHGGNLSSNQAFIVKAVNQMIEKYKETYPLQMKLLHRKNILREANHRALTAVSSQGLSWFVSNIQFSKGYFKTVIKYIFWKKPVTNIQ